MLLLPPRTSLFPYSTLFRSTWLNDAVKGYLSPRGDFDPYLELPHLRVFTARPKYLLAMKSASMRLGAEFHDLRSEEHTSELQSQSNLVCRLLLEKKQPKKHH